MVLTPSGIFIDFRLSHESKASGPIWESDSGRVNETNFLQLINADASMMATPSGMFNDSKLVQPMNAAAPIFVTLSGIFRVLKE